MGIQHDFDSGGIGKCGKDDAPSIVRHIQDLAMLKDIAIKSPAFVTLVAAAMQRDNDRPKNNPSFFKLSIQEKFAQMTSVLVADKEYPKEYAHFVQSTSYAQDNSIPTFDKAMEAVRQLIQPSIL